MGAKHTPGPWYIEEPSKGTPCHIVYGGPTNAEVASVFSGEADQKSNARLIAAAPELLAACESAPIIRLEESLDDFKVRYQAWYRGMVMTVKKAKDSK